MNDRELAQISEQTVCNTVQIDPYLGVVGCFPIVFYLTPVNSLISAISVQFHNYSNVYSKSVICTPLSIFF